MTPAYSRESLLLDVAVRLSVPVHVTGQGSRLSARVPRETDLPDIAEDDRKSAGPRQCLRR